MPPHPVLDHVVELGREARGVVCGVFDLSVGVDKNGEEDVEQDEEEDEDKGPHVEVHCVDLGGVHEAGVELCRVKIEEEDDEGHAGALDGAHHLILVPKQDRPNARVPHKHEPKEDKKVPELRGGGPDGARDEPHPLLEVEALELPEDKEHRGYARVDGVELEGGGEFLDVVEEDEELELLAGVGQEGPHGGGGLLEDIVG
mmetsp:Transcript_33413/g.81490  ORF Transcript_33413/g.81490 Transcript_33413/m.81490 type:complete len:201 (-) Transcript_33413:1771-2373(-)